MHGYLIQFDAKKIRKSLTQFFFCQIDVEISKATSISCTNQCVSVFSMTIAVQYLSVSHNAFWSFSRWNESDNKLQDFIYSNLDDSEVDNCAYKVWNLNWTASHSGSGLTGLVKDILRYGQNTLPDLVLWNYRKNPRIILGVDFMDQDVLRFSKSSHQDLELLKHWLCTLAEGLK